MRLLLFWKLLLNLPSPTTSFTEHCLLVDKMPYLLSPCRSACKNTRLPPRSHHGTAVLKNKPSTVNISNNILKTGLLYFVAHNELLSPKLQRHKGKISRTVYIFTQTHTHTLWGGSPGTLQRGRNTQQVQSHWSDDRGRRKVEKTQVHTHTLAWQGVISTHPLGHAHKHKNRTFWRLCVKTRRDEEGKRTSAYHWTLWQPDVPTMPQSYYSS